MIKPNESALRVSTATMAGVETGIPSRARVSRLCSSTTDAIGRRIISGDLQPGEQLPTEAVLCSQLRVSRTTLREAIKRLHGKGLLDGGPRTGTKVLPVAFWNQLDSDVLGWRAAGGFDAQLADHLYELRGCIEPQACRLAAQRANPSERAGISALFDRLANHDGDVGAHVAIDVAFHLAVFAASHNPLLISLGTAIRTGLELAFQQSQQRARMSESELRLHGRIAKAIARGKAGQAASTMERLLAESRLALATNETGGNLK